MLEQNFKYAISEKFADTITYSTELIDTNEVGLFLKIGRMRVLLDQTSAEPKPVPSYVTKAQLNIKCASRTNKHGHMLMVSNPVTGGIFLIPVEYDSGLYNTLAKDGGDMVVFSYHLRKVFVMVNIIIYLDSCTGLRAVVKFSLFKQEVNHYLGDTGSAAMLA